LLEKLGVPFEWVAKYGAAEEQNSTHKEAYLFELAFLHAATNRLDEVVRTVLPYIQKGNPRNYFSWRILSKTNLQAQAAIPYLLEKQDNLGRLSYQLMATLAPDSEEIRTLLEKNMHSETPRLAFHASLAIMNVDGNQDLAARQIQSIFEKVLTMPDGDQQLQRSILRTLILWPYSIEALTPALMELGNKSDISMEQITEIFIDRQTDISPLLPRIRKQLNKPLSPTKSGLVEEKRIQLCLALLKQDFNDATAWNHLDQTMKQLGATIPVMCTETALIQTLAPHSSKAQDLLNRYSRANYDLHPGYLAYARALLRKYGLPPTQDNGSQNP